jgi:large subunit ribosomal protein L32
MAVPKRKMSKSRSRTRRAHDALPKPSYPKCPRCGQAVKAHTVCGNCGYYRGVMIVDMDEAAADRSPRKQG